MSLACTRAKDVFLLVGSKVTVRKRVSKGEEDEGETTPADSFTGIKNDASIQREIDAIHLICKVNKKSNPLSGPHDRWWPVLCNQSARHSGMRHHRARKSTGMG